MASIAQIRYGRKDGRGGLTHGHCGVGISAQIDAIGRRASAVVQAVAAMLLGAPVIGAAGFSRLDVVHNAAHDTRHANGFPCH